MSEVDYSGYSPAKNPVRPLVIAWPCFTCRFENGPNWVLLNRVDHDLQVENDSGGTVVSNNSVGHEAKLNRNSWAASNAGSCATAWIV